MKRKELMKIFELLTDISSMIGREIGICACRSGEEYNIGPVSVGDIVSAEVYCNCKKDERAIIFHTHVLSPPLPSDADLKPLKEGRVEEICIGAKVPGGVEIRCYYPCNKKEINQTGNT